MVDLPSLLSKEIKDKKQIIGGTKLEQERWRKKNVGETEEKLDAIGSPNEKQGIKEAQKAVKEWELENKAVKSDRIFWLNSKAKYAQDKIDYYFHVDTLVKYELSYLRLPPNYFVKSEVTPRGIKLILTDRWGDLHAGAFTPCGLGLYDEQACRTSVNKIDDLITYLENHPPSGVYIP